ncbi:hypothetical protein [Methylovulum psychrotolerans]|uniref:Uncharacterized protein n=1 Tax=Methylovulum psychrotolerans TaxID=1704499 RepID=A0A1Z4BWB3_9GAMM|nr:hypothetical protein [Methylovulum psychrotolerans]ASF45584.1 hypothetical protein CEK71_05590 [Methylovulum psychrotolerans]
MWPFKRKTFRLDNLKELERCYGIPSQKNTLLNIDIYYVFIYIHGSIDVNSCPKYKLLVDALLASGAGVDNIDGPFVLSSYGLFPKLYDRVDLPNALATCVKNIKSLPLDGISGVYGVSKGIAFEAGSEFRKNYTYVLEHHKEIYKLLLSCDLYNTHDPMDDDGLQRRFNGYKKRR